MFTFIWLSAEVSPQLRPAGQRKEVCSLFRFSLYMSVHIMQLPCKRCGTCALSAFKPMKATGSFMHVPISSHSQTYQIQPTISISAKMTGVNDSIVILMYIYFITRKTRLFLPLCIDHLQFLQKLIIPIFFLLFH